MSVAPPLPRRALLLAVLPLLARGGEPETGPAPFADIAGTWRLLTVNGAALPFKESWSDWLFERRLEVAGEGRFQQFDVYCTAWLETCPRRERSMASTLSRTNDGRIFMDYGAWSSVQARVDASGSYEVTFINLAAGGGPRHTTTFRYQRR